MENRVFLAENETDLVKIDPENHISLVDTLQNAWYTVSAK